MSSENSRAKRKNGIPTRSEEPKPIIFNVVNPPNKMYKMKEILAGNDIPN
jgi:hypothetical protein